MEYYNLLNNGTMSKEATLAPEQGKKKRQPRKKHENKGTKSPIDTEDVVILSQNPQEIVNSDVARYALKLEYELLYTRKKLKKQRKTFENLLKSLTLYFDCKQITPQMIDEYVQGVKNQIGRDSDEDDETYIGKNPLKKVQQEEVSISSAQLNLENAQLIAAKPSDRAAKGNTAKASANLIKINLNEQNAQQQASTPSSKVKGSKKTSKAEKTDVVILDMPPESLKQKRKPTKKKNNDAKKEIDSAPIIKENSVVISGIKAGDLREINQVPKITVDQHHIQPQHYLPQHIKPHLLLPQTGFTNFDDEITNKFGMMMSNNIINPMLGLSTEELSRILQGSVPQINSNEDFYNQNKVFNSVSKDMEKMYRNFLPPRTFEN